MDHFHEELCGIARMLKLADETQDIAGRLIKLADSLSPGSDQDEVAWRNASTTFVHDSLYAFTKGVRFVFRDRKKYQNAWAIIKYFPISAKAQRAFIYRKEGDEGYVNFICRLYELIRLVRLLKYQLRIALWY